ncbi:N-acetylglucosamine-6-phosphate deacetylase [Mycoplasma feriruminatoris]|uniref:N-acetylglucosamine-6-phosphate deacetylase n=1 Tax=Mycoplasma feriruminatoris TaxID=1179777 RepID=A0AAX3TEN6_9MOLU|nr:N-acetylglucosamine-6-phosphate deacetylase [Mycoplasma feriruminatoris]WFQ92603.1 N-acetylglucosamine-6-phosphate deacetylase [Mycoplasma feriruminatoris]WFQ94312.1 N-acetylglucosamine-6-phosphate deacetylase [Mycoplasma feriruminatoris]
MILKNTRIVLEDEIINNGYVIIKDKKIIEIGSDYKKKNGIDLNNNWLLPGFIDCHVHGGYGVDFETGNKNRFKHFADNVVKEGVTRYIQASVSNSIQKNDQIYKEFGEFIKANNGKAKCIGAHLEGPFISKFKKGAHQENLLLEPNINLTKKWNKLSNNSLKIVTYACELDDTSYTKFLLKNNIIPSIGHSNLKAKQFDQFYLLGVRHITHLFNGMSGVDQHNPGLVVASFNHKDVLCEIISDGIHLDKEILKMIYSFKTADNLCIITDAMNAKGLDDGIYKLGNLEVYKKGIEIRLTNNNALAGAGSTYDHNIRVFKDVCDIKMTDLIKMTSINIAKQLNIFDITGSIEVNKLADLVVLDDDLYVNKVLVEGRIVFKNTKNKKL